MAVPSMPLAKEKVKHLHPQEYESIFFLELENLKLRAINTVLTFERIKAELAFALKKAESEFDEQKRKLDIEYMAITRKIMVDTGIPESEWHLWEINTEIQRITQGKEDKEG